MKVAVVVERMYWFEVNHMPRAPQLLSSPSMIICSGECRESEKEGVLEFPGERKVEKKHTVRTP